MIFRAFKAEHLYAVDVQDAQKAAASFMRWPIAKAAEEQGVGWTGYAETGEVIGCAGFAPAEDKLIAWAIFSPLFKRHVSAIVRKVRAECAARPDIRIEAHVMAGHMKAARFAEAVGFAFEREAVERHPCGASYAVFVRR